MKYLYWLQAAPLLVWAAWTLAALLMLPLLSVVLMWRRRAR